MSLVRVHQSLVTHRKTLRLARLLGMDRYATVGRLVALWAWSLDNALDGVFGDDIDPDVLADVMGWDASMGRPSELVDALITAGFLDVDPSDHRLHIHGWHQHMERLIEKREQDAERKRRQQRRHRWTSRDKRRVEKRRVHLQRTLPPKRENVRARTRLLRHAQHERLIPLELPVPAGSWPPKSGAPCVTWR